MLMNDRLVLVLVLVLVLFGVTSAGCGGGGPAGDGTEITATPPCATNKLTLVGEVEGQPVDLTIDLTSSTFQQLNVPYTADLGYVGGSAHLQWNISIGADGRAVAATGNVVMPAGAPRAGETICGGKGTIKGMDPTGMGFKLSQLFTLGTLTVGATCPGMAVAGGVRGCVGQ
jgi:hypothetical protein